MLSQSLRTMLSTVQLPIIMLQAKAYFSQHSNSELLEINSRRSVRTDGHISLGLVFSSALLLMT